MTKEKKLKNKSNAICGQSKEKTSFRLLEKLSIEQQEEWFVSGTPLAFETTGEKGNFTS